MVKDNHNRIIALATVVIAISSLIQGVVGFKQFSGNNSWLDIGILIILGLLLIIAFYLGSLAVSELKQK